MANGNRTKKHKEPRDGEIAKLRGIIRRLESDKRKLLSEVKTLEAAFGKNIQFIRSKTDDFTVEELIEAAKKEQSLKEISNEKNQSFSKIERDWKCFTCSEGVMKMIVYTNRNGSFYIRKCSSPKCSHRTLPKEYNDRVEKS